MEIHKKSTSFPIFFVLLLASMFSLNAVAVSPATVSGNQASGDYVVNYNYGASYPILATWLEERLDSGPWTVVTDSAQMGTISFSGKVNGTYQYRVGQLEDSYYNYPIPFFVSWSSAVTVVVTGGAPSDMVYSTQSTYSYEARKGDINADGLQDLYIKRTSGGASNNGVIFETILTQQADNTFSVFSANASQKATAASWATINVDIKSADLNIDGFVDLVIKDLSTHIPNAANQLIFSSGSSSNGQASVATSLGSQMTKTMTNISGSFSVPNYFDQFMIQIPVPHHVLVCDYYYDYFYEGLVYGCWYELYTTTVTAYDGNFVSQEGLNFGFAWTDLAQAATDAEFQTTAEFLYDVVGTVLGIDFGKDRPDFNDQGAVEEVLAKIWVILSSLCGEANVSECIPEGAGPVSQSASNHLKGALNCIDQLVLGQAPLPFTGSPFRSPKVPHSSAQNFAITSSQLSYSNASTDTARRSFWLSRFNTSKDPLGPLGVNVVDNAYLLGCLANQRTLLYANDYGQTVSLTAIGVDMMVEHRNAAELDSEGSIGKLSASQIRNYHVLVFDRFGLPPQTFGGAPLRGTAFEAEGSKFIWCPSCE